MGRSGSLYKPPGGPSTSEIEEPMRNGLLYEPLDGTSTSKTLLQSSLEQAIISGFKKKDELPYGYLINVLVAMDSENNLVILENKNNNYSVGVLKKANLDELHNNIQNCKKENYGNNKKSAEAEYINKINELSGVTVLVLITYKINKDEDVVMVILYKDDEGGSTLYFNKNKGNFKLKKINSDIRYLQNLR